MNNKNESLIPIILGAVGHRDLRDEDIKKLESSVAGIFDGLKKKFPTTPLVLLSGLAEGADRLIVRIGLDKGARLIVPMPMEKDKYMEDFKTDKSRQEFNELLKHAENTFPLSLTDENHENNKKGVPVNRDLQYRALGSYIARNSQIVIALWDGVDTNKMGGTSDVIRLIYEGVPEDLDPVKNKDFNILEPLESGHIYWIPTPRESHPIDSDFKVRLYKQKKSIVGDIIFKYPQWERIEMYNANAQKFSSKLENDREKSLEYLVDVGRLSVDEKNITKIVLGHYTFSDTLALHYQWWARFTWQLLFILALFAILSFGIYAHISPDNKWCLSAYSITMGVGFIIFKAAKKKEFHDRHLECRALAEALRIQFFWTLSGISNYVADYYLLKQRTELDWIRRALRNIRFLSFQQNTTSEETLQHVYERWVGGQKNEKGQKEYFDKKVDEYEKKRNSRGYTIWGFLIAGVIIACALLFWPNEDSHEENLFHHILILLVVFLPAMAAVYEGYIEKMTFDAELKQYKTAKHMFELAISKRNEIRQKEEKKVITQEESLAKQKEILIQLGKEALIENGDWVIIHRHRPLEFLMKG